MTTKALPAQYDAVRRLSQDAFGVQNEWYALDKHLDPDSATYEGLEALRDALHRVLDEGKALSLQGKKGMLESIMAGTWRPAAPAPDPPVEELIPEPDLTAIRKALDEPNVDLGYPLDEQPTTNSSPISTGLVGPNQQIDGADPLGPAYDQPDPDPQPEEETLPRPLKPIEHGTVAGAAAHIKRGEPLCDPCRDAKNAYQREQRAKKSGTRRAASTGTPAGEARSSGASSPKPQSDQAADYRESTGGRDSGPSRGRGRGAGARDARGSRVADKEGSARSGGRKGGQSRRGEARTGERGPGRDGGRSSDVPSLNGTEPRSRYLNLLLTLAESQEIPDPALLEKIDKLIGIAL